MISLTEFFALNRDIIFFVYGLGFFILGFAIILQAQRSSRLELARSLRWLAAFGITHAVNEWGDLFIPIQAHYLAPVLIKLLLVIQLLLLAASFACLFEFGISVLRPFNGAGWMRGVPAFIFAGWGFLVFFILLPAIPDLQAWDRSANALSRYFIGFPAGLLAAYGLRVHAIRRIKPLDVPVIYRTLRVAGISLGIYAILGGLIPPPVNFFPGNMLNNSTFTQAVGVPPILFRTLISLVIAASVIRSLEVFDLETERKIEELEQQQIISAEHERLARELHDGAIQKVYTAGLLVESAARLTQPKTELAMRLERSVVVLNDAIADLRQNLAELHHSNGLISDTPLIQSLRQLAENPHYNTLVNISLDLKLPEEKSLSPVRTGHLLAILNETLANIVRHAKARNVKILAEDIGEKLQVVIKDDGVGLSSDVQPGYGLRNMRDRARLLNGELHFSEPSSKGTTVTLEIPWID
ncbi:MAG TPA: ATP-binding protein [Anaerolineales bacterium]|nr:ATP-binding protein [Anaerolineales bacterium]